MSKYEIIFCWGGRGFYNPMDDGIFYRPNLSTHTVYVQTTVIGLLEYCRVIRDRSHTEYKNMYIMSVCSDLTEQ